MKAIAAAVLLVWALNGCAWYIAMQSRPSHDTRIELAPRQRMDFNGTSRRNDAGQHMDEYRCPVDNVMICVNRGVVYECECWREGI